MSFLQRTPFFRLLLPLIVGIIFFQLMDFSAVLAWVLLVFSVSFFLTSRFIKNPASIYKSRWMFGLSVTLFLFVLGYYLSFCELQKSTFDYNPSKALFQVEIIETPVLKERTVLCRVQNQLKFDSLQHFSQAKGKALLYIARDSASEMLMDGDRLMIEALYKKPDGVVNPDGFNYAQYLRRQGYGATAYLSADRWKLTGRNNTFSLFRLAGKMQAILLEVYRKFGVVGDEFAVLAALTLGSKDALHPELRQNYTTSGGMHILAVSGLHVGVIYMVINFLLGFLDKSRKTRFLKLALVLLFLWGYAFITGLPPSVIRATTMFSLVAIGMSLDRRSQIYNTISVAAFIMLLFNPNYLFDVGFQLSFSAVISIVYFQPIIAKWFYIKNKPLKWLWELTAVSLAAQVGTAAFSVFYFHQFPNYFLLTNLIAIPAATIIIYMAVILFVLSPIPFISDAVAFVLKLLLKFLNVSISMIHDLPYSLTFAAIDGFQLFFLLVAIILATLFFHNKKYNFLILSLACLFVFFGKGFYRHFETMNADKFIVYSDNQHTHISFINADNQYFLSTDSMAFYKLNTTFSLMRKLNAALELEKQSWFSDGFTVFHEKRFLFLTDEFLHSKYTENPLFVDFLVIGGKQKPRIQQILNCVIPACVITDKSISDWYCSQIRLECSERGIPFYSVAERDAYILSFNR